jgi:hypothetical protein
VVFINPKEAIMAEQHLITAEFFGAPVSIIDHQGQRWLTAEETGRCLGYGADNARKGINKLYNAHADEFTDADTCVVDLATQGQQREIRIFSLTGCVTLGWLSSTPRSRDFRDWAKRVLADKLAGGDMISVTPEEWLDVTQPPHDKDSLHEHARTVMGIEARHKAAQAVGVAYTLPPRPDAKPRITRQVERVIFEMFVAGQSISDLAKHLRLSRTAASLVLHGKYQFGPTTGTPECAPALIEAVAARHLAVEQGRLAAMQDRLANRYLCSAHNLALAAALDQVGQQLQRAPARALLAVGCAERSDAHRSSAHPTKIGGAA